MSVMEPTPERLRERRGAQYQHLSALLGVQSTLVALNMIDQVGIEKADDRADVVDALIASIEKGQAFATGETAIEIVQCHACEGTGHSRSASGRCRACRGFGRRQVKCRACAELEPVKRMQSTCVDCLSVGELDPKTQRDVILRQHREWWERMTKMRTTTEACGIAAMGDNWEPCTRDKGHAGSCAHRPLGALPSKEAVVDSMRAKTYLTDEGVWTLDALDVWHAEIEGRKCSAAERVHGHGLEGGWEAWTDRDEPHVVDRAGPGEVVVNRPTLALASASLAAMLMERRDNVRDSFKRLQDFGNAMADSANRSADAIRRSECVEIPDAPTVSREIAVALLAAQRAIVDVEKTGENDGDGYAYASAEAIIREARKALHGAGLFVMPLSWKTIVVEGERRLEVAWTVNSADGALAFPPISMPIVAEKGRAADKAEAAALTYLQSQFLRELLQIPRVEKSIDVDARVDVGDGGRRRARPKESEDRPLSTELNDIVLALHGAIDGAKDQKALGGVRARLAKAEGLPEAVVAKVREAIDRKAGALLLAAETKS